ncbi:N-acetylglutamate synthase-like GNAT family acetyltransferase [Mucilaginibacter yixingensis]|uniref:N-acetylglutamate synthase-like GNAT family acetyltransferase n=1 Tax=Mucilaginibacter yixingensis TaxID=1295612 RepID=A0A2T5J6G1_9SPHI|nr:GNAT family N-acetyltransferase [Mucilaginibacter yixingensis]PTQ94026.1 N-acetylglutamate synthase-like GNAT family acetyltransferase [Mucilaginibacter yixingensis]
MKVIMNDAAFHKKGYQISTDRSLLDFEVIYQYLDKESYWAQGIPRERLQAAITNSMCFGIYFEQQQVGFARVITDKATFAYLADVFVLETHRKKGLSKWLVQTIVQHPDLQGLRRWSLATADAHGLYAQFGFTPITKADRWMEIFNPYLKPQN